VEKIVAAAHAKHIPVLLDGAQAIPHIKVDVQALNCDFYVFSSHKLYGPSGVGVLYGKQALLEAMPPYQGGGDMIRKVTFAATEYAGLPHKFEAGTPAIAEIIGFGAAIEYVEQIGIEHIATYEAQLLAYATEQAKQIKGLNIFGQAREKGGILSFTLDKIHPHDIGTMLDSLGIAIRAGHHCAMPVMDFYQIPATARASFAMYNTHEEIDLLIQGIKSIIEVFG
jgi:cysteine desulfurase/selenocysteine lyase